MDVSEQVVEEIPNGFMKKYIDCGRQGDCYLTDDNRLFKHYTKKITNYSELKSIASNYQCAHLALPEVFIFLKEIKEENLIGFIRKYIDGKRFSEPCGEIKVSDFIKSLCKLEKELLYNSRYGLEYFDLHEDNILYTLGDEIKIIDQDAYYISHDKEFKSLAKENCYLLASTVISLFYGLTATGIDSITELEYRATGFGSFIKPSEMLEESIYEIEKITCSEISTISDFKSNLVLAKERQYGKNWY